MTTALETSISSDSIMKPIASSTIKRAGYNETTSTLIVEFKSGGTYVYDGVSLDLHDKLMQAESPGAFFAKHIKGKFETTRLADPGPRERKDFNDQDFPELAANLSAP